MRAFVLLLSLLTLPYFVWAGDAAQLDFIGFSKEGHYLAFQQYGITDGEGAAYAITYFIDVKANKYAAKPVETRWEDADESIEAKTKKANLAQAEDQLEKLGIIPNNVGIQVISHLLNDIGVDTQKAQFTLNPVSPNYQTYTLTLAEEEAKKNCAELGESKMFTLTLASEKKSKTLQRDKQVPQSRGCPLAYRIQDVYIYSENYIAVFLNLFTPGFEGQNIRYLVVTGTLN